MSCAFLSTVFPAHMLHFTKGSFLVELLLVSTDRSAENKIERKKRKNGTVSLSVCFLIVGGVKCHFLTLIFVLAVSARHFKFQRLILLLTSVNDNVLFHRFRSVRQHLWADGNCMNKFGTD